jgi:hypothetical protein
LLSYDGAVAHPTATSNPYHRYFQMADHAITDRTLTQDRALVRAIEALGTIEPSGPFERALAQMLATAAQL